VNANPALAEESGSVAGAQEQLRRLIRDVPDFPLPGVLFKDIGPVLADAHGLAAVVSSLAELAQASGADKVAGIEARGFLLAAPVAVAAGLGVIPIRKAGKLPGPTSRVDYALEYGTAALEIQAGVLTGGDRVLLIDDVLATGGTANAAAALVAGAGAVVTGLAVLLELCALGGRRTVAPLRVQALLEV
jgi:adenine phosphoribosyltransferase